MKRKAMILTVIVLLVCMLSIFTACSLQYGQPDKLDIAGESVGMRIWIGIQVALLGIVTVFLVLVLLILFVSLIKWLGVGMNKLSEKKTAKANTKASEKIEEAIVPNASEQEDEEVAAAIVAALTAYYDAQNTVYTSNLKFKVRSIKEIK